MRIVITGNAGFIGSWIADALVDRGHEVLGIDDLSGGLCSNVSGKYEFLEASILDDETYGAAIDVFKPELLYHCAANARESASQYQPVNVIERNYYGYTKILEQCIRIRSLRKVVLLSSMSV